MSPLTQHIDIFPLTISFFFFFFLKSQGVGGHFPIHSYGDILSLLLLQRVYLKNACVLRELECVTPSLDWGAAGTLEKESSSAGFVTSR